MTSNAKASRSAWDAATLEDVGLAAMSSGTKRPALTRSMRDRASMKKQNVHGGVSELEFKRLARLERLELTNSWDPLERAFDLGTNEQGDSSGDEQTRKRRKSEPRKSLQAGRKQVFLSDVIMSEGLSDFVRSQARPSAFPAERVCDVSGKEGRYTDPLTGLYFYDRRAIALLREQTPAWLKGAAISPYWDAVRSLQADGASQ